LGIGPGGIDALVLVGGTCKVPAVRSFVRDIVGVEPDPDIDPMTAIGEGAAIAAAIMVGDNQDNDFFVSTEHALGTFATNGMTGERRFATLIPRNHKLPAKATDTFFPVHDEQEIVNIEVVEGDPDRGDGDMVVLKSWTISVPEAADGDKSFELTYEYDVSGILHVTAVANTDGKVILQGDVSYGVGEDKKKLADIAVRAQRAVAGGDFLQTEGQSDLDTESIELVQRAEVKVIPFLEDNEAAPVQLAVAELRNASASEVSGARGKLREAMAPFSFLF
jgi:molecular chaperone DnaK (HSP70)